MGHFPVLYDSACFFNIFDQYIFQMLKFQSMCVVRTEFFVIVFETLQGPYTQEGIGTLLIGILLSNFVPLSNSSGRY